MPQGALGFVVPGFGGVTPGKKKDTAQGWEDRSRSCGTLGRYFSRASSLLNRLISSSLCSCPCYFHFPLIFPLTPLPLYSVLWSR